MKKEYIIPSVYVVEVKGCQLLNGASSVSLDGDTTTDEQCVRRFIDDDEEEDNGSLLLGEPKN